MLTLAIVSLVAVFATIALADVVHRRSLRAPKGTGERVLDVPDLAYLAGGPARAAVCALNTLVDEGVISISDEGVVSLTSAETPVVATASSPVTAAPAVTIAPENRALVVDTMATHAGSMPLGQLWDKLLKSPAMGQSAKRLRRQHLLLPPDYRPPAWSRALIILATVLATAAPAWSAAKAQIRASRSAASRQPLARSPDGAPAPGTVSRSPTRAARCWFPRSPTTGATACRTCPGTRPRCSAPRHSVNCTCVTS